MQEENGKLPLNEYDLNFIRVNAILDSEFLYSMGMIDYSLIIFKVFKKSPD